VLMIRPVTDTRSTWPPDKWMNLIIALVSSLAESALNGLNGRRSGGISGSLYRKGLVY